MVFRINITLILVLLSSFFSKNAYSQEQRTKDSLEKVISIHPSDTDVVKAYISLYNITRFGDPVNSVKYVDKALDLSRKINFQKGIQSCYLNKSIVFFSKAEYDSSIYFVNQVISLMEKNFSSMRNAGNAYNILGAIKYRQGNFKEALQNFIKATDIFYGIDNKASVLVAKGNMVLIYLQLEDIKGALKESFDCENLALEVKDNKGLSSIYLNRAVIYDKYKNKDSILHYYDKSYKIAETYNDINLMSRIINNTGAIYTDEKDFKKARVYFEKALRLRKQIQDVQGIVESTSQLAVVYHELKDFKKAEQLYSEAETLSKEYGLLSNQSELSGKLADLYEQMGNFKLAFYKEKDFKILSDSIKNNSSRDALNELTNKFESDKKDKEIQLLNKEKKLHEAELSAQNFQRNASLIGLGLALIFLIFVYRNYKQKQKNSKIIELQKLQVEEKNKNITDSITYAKRIQEIVLSSESSLKTFFSDYFVLFKPKDIVSGDFYWSTENKTHYFFALCDSTGHGVPGAFMSLLNIGFLNEAINEKLIYEPGKIFDFVRMRLIETLGKDGQKDGFDGVIIAIEKNSKHVTYAAANVSPLLIKGNGEVLQLEKDKMPVGLGGKHDDFQTRELPNDNNSLLYLYSDGFADQFGGDRGKKMMYKKLQEAILSVKIKPMEEQKHMLETIFENWRGRLEQVDDVCVIGLKL
ncbi:MAG: tetratricopeptide repeat protein [Bacteroidia bacterium]